MFGVLGDLTGWVTGVVETFGYPGVLALVALENLFPPIPSELILPLAGFLVGQGRFQFVLALLAATLGSVIGALVLYAVGHWLGEQRLRRLVCRYGRFALLEISDLDEAVKRFNQYGGAAVFLGRLLPGIRSLISLPAGIERMSLVPFVLYTAAGSAIWNGVLIGFGWALGDQWSIVQSYVNWLQYVVIAAVLGLIAWFIWKRRFARD